MALLNRNDPRLERRVRQHAVPDVGLSSLVAFELYYGAFKSRRAGDDVARLDSVGLEVVLFDASDARSAGSVRAELEHSGLPIGPETS